MNFETIIDGVNGTHEIVLEGVIFRAKPALVKQVIDHFPPGTRVKVFVENDEIKSIVRWETSQWKA